MTKEKKKAQTLERAVKIAARGTQVGIAAATGDRAAILMASLSLFPEVLGAFLPAIFERRRNEVGRWWEEVVDANAPAPGVAAEIENKIGQEEVQETVMAGFTAVLNRLAPEALTPLALLTREYARGGKPPDLFFRSLARILTEVSSAEYRAFKQLIGEIAKRSEAEIEVQLPESAAQPFSVKEVEAGCLEVLGDNLERPFSMMLSAGLGRMHKTGRFDIAPGRLMMVQPEVALRVLALLQNPVIEASGPATANHI